MFGKQFEVIAFCSKYALIKLMITAVERQKTATLTHRAVVERRIVVEEYGFNIEVAVVKTAVSIRDTVVERTVHEVA